MNSVSRKLICYKSSLTSTRFSAKHLLSIFLCVIMLSPFEFPTLKGRLVGCLGFMAYQPL